MAKTRFINPLFQRTETPRPQVDATQDTGEEQPLAEPTPISASVQSTFLAPDAPAARQQSATSGRPARVATPTRARPQPAARKAPAAAATTTTDDEPAVKFTFYFSPAQLRQLDDLWVKAKTEHNQKISKSEFVRVAVGRLLDDFDKNPDRVLKLLKRER